MTTLGKSLVLKGILRSALLAKIIVGCFALVLLLGSNAFAEEPMLYFFTSKGCAPCIQVKETVKKLGDEGYPVTTIDVDDRPDWADAFRVSRTPTLALVQSNQVLAYQPRGMRAQELRDWFRSVEFVPTRSTAVAAPNRPPERTTTRPSQTKVSIPARDAGAGAKASFASATMHKGTANPSNQQEKLALDSTVRLQVKDEAGTSYATGTIVHSHEGESLVLTCGHVFRDSKGKGQVTAELGFGTSSVVEVPGQVLDYDSNANDIALVVIRNGDHKVSSVEIADADSSIDRGDRVFSLGCDNGNDPTIRNTAIKNLARYDGSMKYDIFGRPVNGRSGGGLFNAQGQLIGVCNAAAVEVDEGIYTALETVHWQIAKTNLDHLFDAQPQSPIRPNRLERDRTAIASNTDSNQRMVPIGRRQASPARDRMSQIRNVGFEQLVQSDSDTEVLITIRSKSNPQDSRTITISDPTPKLLDYLNGMEGDENRELQMAQYRQWK